jgi:hypothetical protein
VAGLAAGAGELVAWENLDNAQTGLHDWFMWLKYGFGRGCQQISVDVRAGNVKREHALAWLDEHEGAFPLDLCRRVPRARCWIASAWTRGQFQQLMERFTNREIHAG